MRSLAFIVILAIVLAYIAECQAADSNIRYKDMPVTPPSVPSMGASGAYSDICVVVRAVVSQVDGLVSQVVSTWRTKIAKG